MERNARWWRYYYAIQEILAVNKEYLDSIDTKKECVGDIREESKLPTTLLLDAERCTMVHLKDISVEFDDCIYKQYIKYNNRIQRMDNNEL